MILSSLNTCLQILVGHKWFISASAGGIHTLVYALLTWHGILYKMQLLECSIAEKTTVSPHSTGLNHLNDEKRAGCQINRHQGLTHSLHSSLGASDARSSPNRLSIKCLCERGCGCNISHYFLGVWFFFFISLTSKNFLYYYPAVL